MKEFLSNHNIDFRHVDLFEHPEKEAELKERTGSKIVPGIIIRKSRFLGLSKKDFTFIGFELNKKEIEKLLL